MLSRILEEMRKAEGPVTSAELAKKLGIDLSTLEGMLELLEKQGKLHRKREMTVEECQQEQDRAVLSLYGNLCAFVRPEDAVTLYEVTT
jgi:Mn-dependent DtxR family transcriptional regulator